MKKTLGFLLLIALCLTNTAYAKKNTTMIGTIMAFECGDNCYLTIVDEQGQDHQALCADDNVCEKIMNNPDDPVLAGYKRKLVKVTIGQGKQYDGAGTVMGTMDAFEKIQVLP
ncbi:MAG: hypothetical protein LUQ28_15645 [Methylococcaceae bacterium]|nr:hypothetical protein [Methylococcaceae bacterium]